MYPFIVVNIVPKGPSFNILPTQQISLSLSNHLSNLKLDLYFY